MPNREPETLGEISRRLDSHEQRVAGDFAEVRGTCIAQAAQSVSLGVYAAERQADKDEVKDLRERLKSLEGRITWAWRTAITSLVAPIVVGLVVLVARSGS